MSYLQFSRNLNVPNLTNKELIDLIKKNEYYSGCYSIIQEENLKGVDILNLSENSLTAWKLPQWLTKKLLSLKETLSKNPESLLEIEENEDPRKNISKTLSTLLMNKQKPKVPIKKPVGENHGGQTIKNEPEGELIYDDDNYLQPQFNNSIRKQSVHKFDRPVLKLPEKPANRRGNSDESFPLSRKPVALPRPDLDDEENEYELPPSHTSKPKKSTAKPPLPPPPADEDQDEYEAPPRIEEKQSESSELDYEYIETKKENKKSKFYVDTDFPPPLPERSTLLQIAKKKWTFVPLYMNVEKSPTTNIPSPSSTQPRKSGRKISPKPNRSPSPVIVDPSNSERKKSWSVLTRPLPPLPLAPEHQPPLSRVAKKDVESWDAETEYENSRNENTETDEPAEYGNINESSNEPVKQNLFAELKLRTSTQPKDHIDDLRSHLSNFKLKSSHAKLNQLNFSEGSKELKEKLDKRLSKNESIGITNHFNSKKEMNLSKSKMKLPLPPLLLPQNVQNSYFDEIIKKNQNASTDFGHDSNSENEDAEEFPEYLNTNESKSSPRRNEHNLKSPSSQLAHQISQIKLKSTTPKWEHSNITERNWGVQEKPSNQEKHEIHNDFEDEEEFDDQPEYLNTTETQNLETRVKQVEKHTQPFGSSLASQINKIELKSTPKKDIHLNDSLADELRVLLKKRKGQSENIETGRAVTTSYTSTQTFHNSSNDHSHIDHEDDDDFENEDYDVAGSYNEMLNFNNEQFFRNTDRKGALALLGDLENGAFLLRPSSKYFLSITIKNNGKYFNLGIEKTPNNKIFCGEGMMRTQEFSSLKTFLEYFEFHPLILQADRGLEEVYLKKVLPSDRF